MSVNITEALVQHILNTEYSSIPASVISVQKRSLMDMISVMLAATSMDAPSTAFRAFAERYPGGGSCTLLGCDTRVSPMMAALANGALVHALDYEDSHELATVHPNSASVPALLALAEHVGGICGKEFLTALVLASDICCRLDLGVNEDLLKYGWNMPPIHGSMGAVMGAAKLLRLEYDQILDAIALNMSQVVSSGEAARSRESVIRSVREGFAAEAAVKSVLLAQQGIKARFETPFEGDLGYYHMYARDNYTPKCIVDGLGEVWQSEFISFKPWPTCRATHTSIEAVQALMKKYEIVPGEIQNIHVVMQEIGRMVFEPEAVKYRPASATIAKFSLPFIIGTVVKFGEVTLTSFSEARLNDADILAIADKVSYEIDETLTKAQNKYTDVIIGTSRGTFKMHMEFPLGCREHPMSDAQTCAKFFDCAGLAVKGYSKRRLTQIYDTINQLETLPDVRELTSLF